MKVLLTTLNSKYSHVNIALYYLKNVLNNSCDASILQFTINDALDHILEKILDIQAPVICFGCYIWNREETLKLCKTIKQLNPSVKIILGGPEVSYDTESILKEHPYVDSILCTQAENSIKKCILDIQENSLQKVYDIPVSVQEIPRIANDILANYDHRVVYFETSRGCPYRCSYCLSCIDKTIGYFPIEQVKEDLTLLLEANVSQIRFIDRTFNSDRKRALEIWKFLIKHRKDTTFHFEICAALIEEETLSFLKQVPKGVFQFEIGVQSTNRKTLEAICRNYRWDLERQVIEKLVQMGNILLHTDLIVGLPYEDMNRLQDSFNELYRLHTNEVQIGFLKFLKGTTLYNQKEQFDYHYLSYPPYEVLENTYLSFDEIRFMKKLEIIFDIVYNSHFLENTLALLEEQYDTPFAMFQDITNYAISKKLLDRKISYDTLFEMLYEKYRQTNFSTLIQQSLTYDYFLKFKGTREWFYAPYQDVLKEHIHEFIDTNRKTLFENKDNSILFKKYKFCILDYNFDNKQPEKHKIYFKSK